MNESENSEVVFDEFEVFLDGDPYWEEVDEYVGEIHTEHHAGDDMDHCVACDELFDRAEETLKD